PIIEVLHRRIFDVLTLGNKLKLWKRGNKNDLDIQFWKSRILRISINLYNLEELRYYEGSIGSKNALPLSFMHFPVLKVYDIQFWKSRKLRIFQYSTLEGESNAG
ncbi:hypothetical protein RhiirA1_481996, partial [Rhizophagus irregularis]